MRSTHEPSPGSVALVGGALVEEDVDRATPRGEGRRRHERRERRVLVVFAHRDDPHVDAVLPHQAGQDGLQPLLEPRLLHRRLFAQRAEWSRFRLGRGRAREAQCEKQGEDSRLGHLRVPIVAQSAKRQAQSECLSALCALRLALCASSGPSPSSTATTSVPPVGSCPVISDESAGDIGVFLSGNAGCS